MTANRKAELQRKLALAPVPKPPADLADRIKSDIPKGLMVDAEKERKRLRQSVAFNVRVAASIILLVSSVYLALHLLSRKFGPQELATTAMSTPAEKNAPIALPATPPPAPQEKKHNDRQPIIVAEARSERPAPRPAERRKEETGSALADQPAGNAQVAQPAAASAPVAEADEEMVQRFASAPMSKTMAAAPDVEASAAPFDASKQILRVSLDGLRDATPDVAFNDDAVASWHTIASDGTSLYEITLRPQTAMRDVIATVRVNGVEHVIRRSDLRSWDSASRRMKSATLAAALEAGVPPKDVAAKARAAGLDDVAAAADARSHR
jgi:hypothetical protein